MLQPCIGCTSSLHRCPQLQRMFGIRHHLYDPVRRFHIVLWFRSERSRNNCKRGAYIDSQNANSQNIRMEHNAPHPGATFEGYYCKFDLPSGAHLAVIVCEVRRAKQRPNMVSFTYVPAKDVGKTFQEEVWPRELHFVEYDKQSHAFGLEAPGVGFKRWQGDFTTEYSFEHEYFTFHAKTTTHRPWSETVDTPEWLLVRLPLPLHWHVHSLGSECEFELKLKDYDLPLEDRKGKAIVHQEKNWSHSFPSAHMWLQARDGDRAFCAAGGQILGLEAFLVGYRSKDLSMDFRPPFALRAAGLSPFLSYHSDFNKRSFEMSVQSFRQKLTVTATAPEGSFFPLSAPFQEGHRPNFLNQTYQATFVIRIYESGWLGPWKLVKEDVFKNASLEFGGGYYPFAGTDDEFH